MPVRLDDLDRKILLELQKDGGQSLDDIAKSVGSSKTPVWNRIRKMREGGVIRQQTFLLSVLPLPVQWIFLLKKISYFWVKLGWREKSDPLADWSID